MMVLKNRCIALPTIALRNIEMKVISYLKTRAPHNTVFLDELGI